MDPRDDEPFDREPWRALLGNDAPPRDVDQRVLTAARRVHRTRMARWYLPASLVASVLLAVLLVQWQLDESRSPAVVSEFDVQPAPPPVRTAKEPPRAAAPIGALQRQAPGAASTARPSAPPETESRPLADTAAPSAPAPQESARARHEADRPEVSADATAAAAPAPAAAARELGKLEVLKESSTERTPEEWYAEIEALREAGRIEEAEAELTRLEAAHPGWLAARESKKH